MSLHVYPINDEHEHDTESMGQCWCNPRIEWVEGESIVVHSAADCREIIEQAEAINAAHNAGGDGK